METGFDLDTHHSVPLKRNISLNKLPQEKGVDHTKPIGGEIDIDDIDIPDHKLLSREAIQKTNKQYHG